MAMTIYRLEPTFTVGCAPFVAGAIHVRNQIRVLKQRDKARRRKAAVERFRRLPAAFLWRLSIRPGRDLERTQTPAAAHA